MNYWGMPNMTIRRDLKEHVIVLKVTTVIFKILSRVCKDKLIDWQGDQLSQMILLILVVLYAIRFVDACHHLIIKIQNFVNSLEREIPGDIYKGLKMNANSKSISIKGYKLNSSSISWREKVMNGFMPYLKGQSHHLES